MKQVHLLGTGKSYDISKQVLKENQIVIFYGMGASEARFVVYRVEHWHESYIYHLINLETGEYRQTDLPRPLKDKFGIGFYYNDETPEFMDAFEVLLLQVEAEKQAKKNQEAEQTKGPKKA